MNDPAHARADGARSTSRVDPELDAAFPKQRAARVAIRSARRPASENSCSPRASAIRKRRCPTPQLDAKYLELAAPVIGEATRAQAARPTVALEARSRDIARRVHDSRAGPVLRPAPIALVGASGDAAKNTARPLRFLRKHGYAGRIVPDQCGSRSEVLGERPGQASPKHQARSITLSSWCRRSSSRRVEDCGARGVPVVDLLHRRLRRRRRRGRGAHKQRLVARARALGVRLLGPNSMGMIDIPAAAARSP